MNDKVVEQPVRLLQLTDPHFGEQPGSQLLGVDTDNSFIQLREQALKQRGAADWLLATGDISNDGSLASYQRFYQHSQTLAANSRWLPGNHDELLAMKAAINGGPELQKLIELKHWSIILLNSQVKGEVGGAFSASELKFLADALEHCRDRHVLLCMHHHPIASGCAWLDQQQVANADDFFAIVDRHPQVRAVLWGHIHQEVDTRRKGIRLLASPSCCIQFAVNSADFKIDEQQPGYRWLELYADGQLETAIERLPVGSISVDVETAKGY